MSAAKKSSKKSDKKLLIPNYMCSKGKKRATARRKHRKLRVAADQKTS